MKVERFLGIIKDNLPDDCSILVSYETPFWAIEFSQDKYTVGIHIAAAVQKKYSRGPTIRLAQTALEELEKLEFWKG